MGDDGKIVITLDLESGKFTSDIEVIKSQLGGIGEAGATSAGQIAEGFLLAQAIIEGFKIAFDFVKDTLRESVVAAMENEQSLTRMNLALANAGIYSATTSNSMQEFANQLSETSTYSKEIILQMETMGLNFAKTEDGAKKLTQAAIELSSATGKDVNTSMRILGQSMNGMTVGLDKLVPGLKNLTEEQLRAGAAADIIIARFGGSALINTQTFAGHISLLQKTWAELHTEIGKAITQSPEISRLIEGITIAIGKMTDFVKEFVSTGGINAMIKSTTDFGISVATNLVKPLELFYNFGKFVFLELRAVIDSFILVIATAGNSIVQNFIPPLQLVGETAGRVIGLVNKNLGESITASAKSIGEGVKTFASSLSDSTMATFKEHAKEGGEALKNMFDTSWNDKAIADISKFQTFMQGAKAPMADIVKQNHEIEKSTVNVAQAFNFMASGITTQAKDMAAKAGKDFEAMGKQMLDAIGHGAANAFSSFGAALAKGENALQAFGKALLQSIGQEAVNIGTKFILEGTAYMFAPGFEEFGPPLIAAGAALATFGGALGAVAGGGAPTAGGGAPGSSTPSSTGQPQQTAASTPNKQASIIINGDFLNSRETANHLADVLRQNSDITDYTVTAQGRSYI